jgi:hypothetical protein
MALTSEAKRLLAETIRGTAQDPAKGLRHRLLEAIRSEAAGRYRLAVPLKEAGLDEAHRRRRERLEAYLDEKTRATKPKNASESTKTRERLLREAEKEAAATLLNRLITLRLLEARGLSRPAVVTGGWNSKGYREFRDFAPRLIDDETEGYAFLLQLVFDDLATDLPGLFGDVGVTRLFPVPAKSLRDVVEALDNPELTSAWTDDVTLGWVYQYWNDPDREGLDAKINSRGKILPHEIASKTQMFTERYMVEWLLQNSLGQTWFCMCKKHGWTADAERILPVLDDRRSAWRKKREAGAVTLEALMPIEGELEEHWKYYVPQPLPDDAVSTAPESVKALKLLDPACGSGHFLVIAFDLLASLYREEAQHRGQSVTDREIAESILESNLHGIDIDPRAIQIAAASLYLKSKTFSKEARPRRLNLVAPTLQLGNLPKDDPAVVQLRQDLKLEVGIPEELTAGLLSSLAGVDYLGSLLKVDAAIDEALRSVELEFERTHGQGNLFSGFPAQQVKLTIGEARATVLDRLERFLARHSSSEDLGLRLDGEQLAAGVRFVRMAKEGSCDIVVGNPPYQALSKTEKFGYVSKTYPRGKADLYAAFLERGLELVRLGGVSAMVTMRGWMFISQFRELREFLLRMEDLRALVDLDSGAFEEISAAQVVVSVVCAAFVKVSPQRTATALRPTPVEDRASTGMTARKRAGLLAHVGRYEFDPRGFEVIEGEPIVYWWSEAELARYAATPKLGEVAKIREGVGTKNDLRYLRMWWELPARNIMNREFGPVRSWTGERWVPFVKGAEGREWIEGVRDVINWRYAGLEIATYAKSRFGRGATYYFRRGIAFTMIGSEFAGRLHHRPSIFGHMGGSAFPETPEDVLCFLNSRRAKAVAQSLNPTLHFLVGDVNRLPFETTSEAVEIVRRVERAFCEHEATREPSIDFRSPRPSSWKAAVRWAENAVNRRDCAPLPPYEPDSEPPVPESFVSFAIGVALGRFDKDCRGLLDAAPSTALPAGILFVSTEGKDSLDTKPCAPILDAWTKHGAAVGKGDDLRTYLRISFFTYHKDKKQYENRPIYFPLTSKGKNFVAFISIHRWADDTLSILLADHLMPTKKRLEGELGDLGAAKSSETNRANRDRAEKRFAEVQKLVEELNDFTAKVTEIAGRGPPPSDDKTTKREADARFVMDLNDGVRVNSSALWPLLEPMWDEPREWWKQLANERGPRGVHFDWSHLAGRYFPSRVRKKCHDDPSLAVAHDCFWELHPAKAYASELRLQDEIKSDFTIDEPASDAARKRFLAEHAAQAKEILGAEIKRRGRKAAKEESDEPLFDADPDDGEAEADSDD